MSITRPGAGALFTEERARCFGWMAIALMVLLVYWPLSTFQYAPNGGDLLDCWLPWRWFISSSLFNGHFPTWNPLQQMGYPVHADLQGPAWYPEAIAIGGTIGHSLRSLQALYLLYLIIAGIGMMRLVRVVHGDARIGMIAGAAFALCGFFTGNQMHFYSIISGAWLPWLLAAQLRLLSRPHWRSALEAAVVQSLALTGGNHTFTIIGAYLIAALIGVHAWRALRARDLIYLASLARTQALFAALSVIMACGTFYAFFEVRPFMDRSLGLSAQMASDGAFTWEALPSFLFPTHVRHQCTWLGTDATMANRHMGVLMLAFALASFFRRRTFSENTFLAFGSICALAAFGDATPVHGWLYALPGMDLFRFPSYFMVFTIISVMVLAAGSMCHHAQWHWPERKVLLICVGALLLLGTTVLLAVPELSPEAPADVPRRSVFEHLRLMGYRQGLIWSWSMSAFVLAIGLTLLWRRSLGIGTLTILVLLEMGWNTQLAQWSSAVTDFHPAVLDSRLSQLPRAPDLPRMSPMGKNTDGAERMHFLWRNTQVFNGQPSHDGFNSFWLSHTYELATRFGPLHDAMERQPLLYLSDRVVPEADFSVDSVDPASDSDLVVLAEERRFLAPLRRAPTDRVVLTAFEHDRISANTSTAAATFLMVQQSWYPAWSIWIDDEPAPVLRANIAAFGTVLPAGEHSVVIRFDEPWIPVLLVISLSSFIAGLFILALTLRSTSRGMALGGTIVLAAMLGWSLLGHTKGADDAGRHADLEDFVESASDDRVLYAFATDVPVALKVGRAFSGSLTMRTDSLFGQDARTLILSVRYRLDPRTKGTWVVDRQLNGRSISYDAVPFPDPAPGDTGWRTAFLVRDVREFRYPDEQVGLYLWNQAPDSLVIQDLRIRTSTRSP